MSQKTFSIEELYQSYLKLVHLSEATMHPQQRIQLKDSYYAACGQMLLLMRDDIALLDENDGVNALQDMLNQVHIFFQKAANRES